MRARIAAVASIVFSSLLSLPAWAVDPPPPSALAPPGVTLTESRALDGFRQQNLQLIAARYDLEATRADIIAASVLPNPNLLVGTAFLLHGVPQSGKREMYAAVDQVLPVGGQVALRRQVAEGFASAAEREFAAVAWMLACDIRESYADMQTIQARHAVIVAGLEDLARLDAIITTRAGSGANPEYDRLRVSVERQNLAGRLSEVEVELAHARVALAQAIGPAVNAGQLQVTSDIPDAPDPPRSVEPIIARAKARRPELMAARLRASAASTRITQIKREYVPSPSVQIGYSHWTGVPVDLGPSSGGGLMVGLGIPLPIFDSGQGRVERAAAEQSAHQTRMRASDLTVEREVTAAIETLRARVEAWRRFRDGTSLNTDRMRSIAEVSYREGRTAVLDLLDSYRAHLEARERAVTFRGTAWRAALVLDRVIGPSS